MTANLQLRQELRTAEQGSDMIEYALVAALLALCAVTATSHLAAVIVGILTNIATSIASAL